ncbi:MAG: glycosyltransferase family 9 protein, partial [Planctomycetota bacterium]
MIYSSEMVLDGRCDSDSAYGGRVLDAQNILLIRPSALGDVCRTVPVLASLRGAAPQARIDWLVQTEFMGAVQHHPALSSVLGFPRKRLSLGNIFRNDGRLAIQELSRNLRTNPRYDLVIDCQGLARSGLFAFLSGAKRRVGYTNAEELGWIWINKRIHAPRSMHTVDRMLSLVESLGIEVVRDMRLYTDKTSQAFAS